MASRCCGNRLSLPKPVRHENPAREPLVGGRQEAALFTAVRRPPRDLAGTVSRHESHAQRGSRNVLGEISQISAKKNFD